MIENNQNCHVAENETFVEGTKTKEKYILKKDGTYANKYGFSQFLYFLFSLSSLIQTQNWKKKGNIFLLWRLERSLNHLQQTWVRNPLILSASQWDVTYRRLRVSMLSV